MRESLVADARPGRSRRPRPRRPAAAARLTAMPLFRRLLFATGGVKSEFIGRLIALCSLAWSWSSLPRSRASPWSFSGRVFSVALCWSRYKYRYRCRWTNFPLTLVSPSLGSHLLRCIVTPSGPWAVPPPQGPTRPHRYLCYFCIADTSNETKSSYSSSLDLCWRMDG